MSKNGNSDGVRARSASTPINTPVKELCCSVENLYKAAHICKRKVMWKDSVAGYIKNGIRNSIKLHNELMSGSYKLSKYAVFTIYEKKKRTIVSTRMRDRVVQRSLCDNYLYHEITKGFIYDNCACLIGKGCDFARNRLKCHLQRYFRKNGKNGYILKVDIHDFFGSTRHDVAKEAVDKRVSDPWAKMMVHEIIDSFDHIAPDRGIGLGSQVSQLIQLAVLDDLDHIIKEQLHIKHYVRYMDDMILIHSSRTHLKYCLEKITEHLTERGFELNERKTGIQPLKHGVKFLGFRFSLSDSGKVIMRLAKGKKGKEKLKLRKMATRIDFNDVNASYKSWRAHASKGDNFFLIADMDEYIKTIRRDTHEQHDEADSTGKTEQST